MDKLRDFLKSWPGRILVLICLSPMVLLGLEGYFGRHSLSADEVAMVEDTPISIAELQAEINTARDALLATQDASLIDEKLLLTQSLDNLIHRALLEHEADALGMHLSDASINRLLQQDPTFFDANGKFSNDLFAHYLLSQGLSKDRLFDLYRKQLNVRYLLSSILKTAIYPSEQSARLVGLQTKTRPLWVMRLPWQDFADDVKIGQDDITAYFNAQPQMLSDESVDLSYIAINPNLLNTPAPSDDELQAAYQGYLAQNNLGTKKLAQILIADNDAAKIDRAVKALNDGQDFADVSRAFSDDSSKAQGGNIGSFNSALFGDDGAQVAQAINALNVGDVSAPIRTQFGTHIFKIIDADDAPSFDALKDTLTQQLQAEHRHVAHQELVQQINNKVADGFALDDIAADLNLSVHQIANYTKNNNQSVLNQPAVLAAAFDEMTLLEQGVSPNLSIGALSVWVQPIHHKPSAPMTLDEAAPIIEQILIKEAAIKKASEYASNLLANLKNTPLEHMQSLGQISSNHPLLNDAERAAVFIHDATDNLAGWTVQTNDGISVFAGDTITVQHNISDAEMSVASMMIKDNLGQDYMEDYLHYLRNHRDVQTNDNVLAGL